MHKKDVSNFVREFIEARGGLEILANEEKETLAGMLAEAKMTPTSYWASLSPGDRADYLHSGKDLAADERKELKELGYNKDDREWQDIDPKKLAIQSAWEDSEHGIAEQKKIAQISIDRHKMRRIKEVKREADAWKKGNCVVNDIEYPKKDCTPFIRTLASQAEAKLKKMLAGTKFA